MPADINLGEDDGFVTVTAADGSSATLDLWQTFNRLRDFHQANKAKPDEQYNEGLVGLMESMGLPRCSHRMADRFVTAIRSRVEQVKNAEGPSPA